MDNKILSLFKTPIGKELFSVALSSVEEYDMKKMITDGVLVGLSGGADSVMLLCFLIEYRRRTVDFPILAVHINHSIRGESADRDERFAREVCASLGVEFISRKIDVPAIAKENGLGIEECARNVRYKEFQDIIRGRSDIKTISVAHNADDNLETVIFNIFRGTGLRGVCGIPPIRDNICRPLIGVKKADIIKSLYEAEIGFVIDETNNETEYRRNYIRHKIVPAISGICDDPAAMVSRLTSNLRFDDEYISMCADNIIGDEICIECKKLRGLHRAVLSRALIKFAKNNCTDLSAVVIDALVNLIDKDNFSYYLTGEKVFLCESGMCRIVPLEEVSRYNYSFKINSEKTILSGFDADFLISKTKFDKTCLNVYKIFIQAKISSAIIVGDLVLRPRRDGDVIYYGGMTRKVKKLFSDLKIPRSYRESIPLLCDDKGVVWVPGLGVRDDGNKGGADLYVCLAIGKGEQPEKIRMRSASEFKQKRLKHYIVFLEKGMENT